MTKSSTGFQFGLFYCSLNAGSFELWYVTVDNLQADLRTLILKFNATENDGSIATPDNNCDNVSDEVRTYLLTHL